MKLQEFDILSCEGQSLIAKGIRLFTGSRTTHTAFVIEIWGSLYIIDAQRNGVNLKPLEEWNKKYNYKYIIHRPKFEIEKQKFTDKAMACIGFSNYDFYSLFIRQPIYILFGKWLGKKSRNDKRFYCSDYVGYCYEDYLPLLLSDYWQLSPVQLKERLDESGMFKTILNG